MATITAVDLFCGAGGLTHGLRLGGINVTAGYDIEPSCKYPFEENNVSEFICKDIEQLTADDLSKHYAHADIRLLAGCAPCQPFSTYSLGKASSTDKKWGLLYSFARLIEEVRPEIVSMENVPQLQKHQVYDDFLERLRSLNYSVTTYKISCPEYGIPQTRTRLVVFASLLGPVEIIPPTHSADNFVTVEDVIKDLPPIASGETSKADPLHTCSRLSKLNLKRIKQSVPGGTWRDWDKELLTACHRKSTGRTFSSVYGRMKWKSPAPTMTTQCYGFGNGRFGHPVQDRAISLREAALFQTFPKNYKFIAPGEQVAIRNIGKLIGNAVPVRLGEVVAESITKHLSDLNIS